MDERAYLTQWVIYDKPKDHPNAIVARRWLVGKAHCKPDCSGLHATEDVLEFPSLEAAREHFDELGFFPLPRSPEDDPVIVETWT